MKTTTKPAPDAADGVVNFIKNNTAVAIILGAGVLAGLTIGGTLAFGGKVQQVDHGITPVNKTQAAVKSDSTSKANDTDGSSDSQTSQSDSSAQTGDQTAAVNNQVAATNPQPVQAIEAASTIPGSDNSATGGSDVNQNPGTGSTGSTGDTDNGSTGTGSTGTTGGTGNGSTGTGSTGTTGGTGSTGTGSTGTGSTGTGSTGTGTTGSTTGGAFTPKTANLLTNPSLATDSTGFSNYVDPANASKLAFSYQATGGQDGNGFLRTVLTDASLTQRYGSTVYGSWSPDPVTVPGSTTPQMYAFSMWYRSDVDTEVDAAIQLSDGTYAYPVLGRPLATSGEWKQFSASITVPAGAQNVTASAIIVTPGTLDTDNFYLGTFTPTAITGGGMVSLTFDDSWKSIHDNARPILNALGLKSTQYVISGALNTDGYMTTADVQDFINDGDEIGDHTVNHIPLTDKASLAAAGTTENNQIADNKTALTGLFPGLSVTDFASPEGEYDSETVTDLQAAQIQSHRSVEEGYNSPDAGVFNPYDIKVQNITRATTLADVQGWLAEAKVTNTWLVIVYHEVTETPAEGTGGATNTQYWTPVADFQAQMDAVSASGLQVVTVNQGVTAISAQL